MPQHGTLGCLGEILHKWGRGHNALVVLWLGRHSPTTTHEKKDCNMSRFWEIW